MTPARAANGAARSDIAVDPGALTEALHLAASRCGRLSDEQVRAMRQRRRTAGAVAATAMTGVVAVLSLTIAWPRTGAPPAPAWTRDIATRAGEQRAVVLADGSSVRLNGASRLRVTFTGTARVAQLAAGEAFFDVRHDTARPFTVRAGAGQVRVLGTAFNLGLTRGQVALDVYRGAVGFAPAGPARGVVVRAGFRTRLRDGTVDAPQRFDPSLPDWRQGWLDTGGMRLDALVDVLNRQSGAQIAPPAEPLASVVVSGRFRTDRPRQLLSAMGAGFDFTVVQRGDGIALRPAD